MEVISGTIFFRIVEILPSSLHALHDLRFLFSLFILTDETVLSPRTLAKLFSGMPAHLMKEIELKVRNRKGEDFENLKVRLSDFGL